MENETIDSNLQGAGAFVDSLKRNNRKIRDDRASAISEDTEKRTRQHA